MKEQVETMRRQHDELRALSARYEHELDQPVPDLPALAKCRWTLARLVSMHLAHEAVLSSALAAQGGRQADLGRKMAAEISELGSRLQYHVREWTPGTIAEDWAGYRRSSKTLIAELRDRMKSEERDLYPAALIAKTA